MAEGKRVAEQTVAVILAAGKGTRMGRPSMGKVCFEIDSVPAINRIISCLKSARFTRFLLVVGSKSEQVLKVVAREHPGVMAVYQSPQLGTGHAAQVAAEVLKSIDHDGNVLVTMGDKYLERPAVDALVAGFVKQQADLALLTLPKSKMPNSAAGRVVVDGNGQALDIIEPAERSLSENEEHVEIGGKRYTVARLEKTAKRVNPSLYLFKAEAFYQGVAKIDNDNPRGQYDLPDVVRHLSGIRDGKGGRRFRVRTVPVENPDWIQGFNSPDELLAIQDYVRRTKAEGRQNGAAVRPQLKSNQYATVGQWLAKLDRRGAGLDRWLRKIYGRHEDLHRQKCKDLEAVLQCYGKRFGLDQKVCIVRAPGRINLMGRHVDHRGGLTNFLAIDRETLAVVGLRDDHDVVAVNTRPRKFKPVRFSISELIGRFAWSDWLNFVNSDWVRKLLYSAQGDWGNYIKAAVLRLQHGYQDVKIRGLNVALSGNVPIAAGLSSSSTIVVATLQAAIALNGFELTSRQFIDLCGEGEWFVGSRGGAGDHAAIYLGQRGKIAHVGYLPFRVEKIIDAPADYQVVIANSHIRATKSTDAKHTFNARIADYNLGFALLKQRCPEIAASLEYVRDIDPKTLGRATSDVYRWLLRVPESADRKEFTAMLSGEHRELIEANFATHDERTRYYPRGVLLFGAAEIHRSAMCVDLLAAGRVEQFGRLMGISHDGDRVARADERGEYRAAEPSCSDRYLEGLIADLASEDPDRVLAAQLYMQPGSYACSTPEIDRMVDVATSVPGVAGAQIAGAGLGGCIMVLAGKESVEAVRRALVKHYYRPTGLKPAVFPCIAVEGAGLMEF